MTIPANQQTWVKYVSSGGTSYAIPFSFMNQADIKVWVIDTSGGITVLTYASGYNVSGGHASTGTVTLTAGPTSGYTVFIFNDPYNGQGTHLLSTGSLPVASIETMVDLLTTLVQRNQSLLTQCLHAPEDDKVSAVTLPEAAARASTLMGFDASGNVVLFPSPISPISSYVRCDGTAPLTGNWTVGGYNFVMGGGAITGFGALVSNTGGAASTGAIRLGDLDQINWTGLSVYGDGSAMVLKGVTPAVVLRATTTFASTGQAYFILGDSSQDKMYFGFDQRHDNNLRLSLMGSTGTTTGTKRLLMSHGNIGDFWVLDADSLTSTGNITAGSPVVTNVPAAVTAKVLAGAVLFSAIQIADNVSVVNDATHFTVVNGSASYPTGGGTIANQDTGVLHTYTAYNASTKKFTVASTAGMLAGDSTYASIGIPLYAAVASGGVGATTLTLDRNCVSTITGLTFYIGNPSFGNLTMGTAGTRIGVDGGVLNLYGATPLSNPQAGILYIHNNDPYHTPGRTCGITFFNDAPLLTRGVGPAGVPIGTFNFYVENDNPGPIGSGNMAIVVCDGTNYRNALSSDHSGNLTFGGSTSTLHTLFGRLSISNGTAAAPTLTFAAGATTGFYSIGATTIGISSNGVKVGGVDSAGTWTLGKDQSSNLLLTTSDIAMNSSGVAGVANLFTAGTTSDSLTFSGGINAATNGIITLYGSAHASKASKTEFSNAGILSGSISSGGAWTIGVASGTANQIINGFLIVNYGGVQTLRSDNFGDLHVGGAGSVLRNYGQAIFLNYAGTAAATSYIATNVLTGALALGGGNSTPDINSAGVYFYANAHATKANKTEFYNNAVLSASVTAAGVWNIPTLTATTIGVGGAAAASSILSLTSTSLGFLPPVMTSTQRTAVSSPAAGLQLHNSTTTSPEYYDGAAWQKTGAKQVPAVTPNTSNSAANANTSFTAFDTSPAITFTATRSGKYKIWVNQPFVASGTVGHSYFLKVANTVGAATITFNGEVYEEIAVSGRTKTLLVFTIATLTAGTSYTFTLQGKVGNAADNVILVNAGPTNGVAMIAEEMD